MAKIKALRAKSVFKIGVGGWIIGHRVALRHVAVQPITTRSDRRIVAS